MQVEVIKSFICGVKKKQFFKGDIVDYADDVAERRVNKNKVARLKEDKIVIVTKEEKFNPETKKKRGRPFRT
jgi:hypothetical protein